MENYQGRPVLDRLLHMQCVSTIFISVFCNDWYIIVSFVVYQSIQNGSIWVSLAVAVSCMILSSFSRQRCDWCMNSYRTMKSNKKNLRQSVEECCSINFLTLRRPLRKTKVGGTCEVAASTCHRQKKRSAMKWLTTHEWAWLEWNEDHLQDLIFLDMHCGHPQFPSSSILKFETSL
jgi:hypothetical protein